MFVFVFNFYFDFNIIWFSYVCLNVSDLVVLWKFYIEIFGFQVIDEIDSYVYLCVMEECGYYCVIL